MSYLSTRISLTEAYEFASNMDSPERLYEALNTLKKGAWQTTLVPQGTRWAFDDGSAVYMSDHGRVIVVNFAGDKHLLLEGRQPETFEPDSVFSLEDAVSVADTFIAPFDDPRDVRRALAETNLPCTLQGNGHTALYRFTDGSGIELSDMGGVNVTGGSRPDAETLLRGPRGQLDRLQNAQVETLRAAREILRPSDYTDQEKHKALIAVIDALERLMAE